jgi:hypothetical protein
LRWLGFVERSWSNALESLSAQSGGIIQLQRAGKRAEALLLAQAMVIGERAADDVH